MSVSLLAKKTSSSGILFVILLKLIIAKFKLFEIKLLKFSLVLGESGSQLDEDDSMFSASWVAGVQNSKFALLSLTLQ